jgi:hypothetical protein
MSVKGNRGNSLTRAFDGQVAPKPASPNPALGRLASREGRLAIGGRSGFARRDLLAMAAFSLAAGTPNFAWAAAPQGQLTWAVHVSLAPTWFEPAETPRASRFV